MSKEIEPGVLIYLHELIIFAVFQEECNNA